MAGATTFYKLAYFDFRDRLDSAINIKKETDRFMLIDSQLYGMYNVFSNGVVNGWEAYDSSEFYESGIYIGITVGNGIIGYTACQSYTPQVIGPLPVSSTFSIYAIYVDSSTENREVTFVFDSDLTNAYAIKIADVVTGTNGITSIDNTSREYIGFAQYLQDAINSHKHRGTPTKIDLETETKNALPGAKIDSFNAEQVKNGRFDKERIPTIAHGELSGKGVLSHAALDTFAQGLATSSNMELIGEIASINLLKLVIALRYDDSDIDSYLINELTYLPALTTNVADADASTAYIDEDEGYVVGLPIGDALYSYFYTNNFVLPGGVEKVILTSNDNIPDTSDIQFGINTSNSTTWSDYTLISQDTVEDIVSVSNNIRVGILFTGPHGSGGSHDPYAEAFADFVDFVYVNSAVFNYFHFRIRFYTDVGMSVLYKTEFSFNNTEGWIIDDVNSMPAAGWPISNGSSVAVTYYPSLHEFEVGKTYYLKIDAWNGSAFVSETDGYTFITDGDSTTGPYTNMPFIRNFALMLQLDNGQKIRLNV